ncbi:hypothetical protein D3C81_2109170 [compost metagenome]
MLSDLFHCRELTRRQHHQLIHLSCDARGGLRLAYQTVTGLLKHRTSKPIGELGGLGEDCMRVMQFSTKAIKNAFAA